MPDADPIVIGSSEAARAAMLELAAWAARLEESVSKLAHERLLVAPAVVYRLSHPARRALATSQADAKLWEAYPPPCSGSAVWEIHIHPRETDSRTIVVAALAGLSKAVVGSCHGLGRHYGKVASKLGLAPGPSRRARGGTSWRHPVAAAHSLSAIDRIAASLGPIPLGALDASKTRRRVADRNLRKAVCPTCGPTNVRLSRQALEERILLCGGARETPHPPAVMTLGRDEPKIERRRPSNRRGLVHLHLLAR
jgi:hypothetical protein